jgi:hypothetical protein
MPRKKARRKIRTKERVSIFYDEAVLLGGDSDFVPVIQHLRTSGKKVTCEEKLSFSKALALFEAMWKEGVALGVLPPKDPLEGIEVDIRIARILNCLKNS